MDQVLLAKVQKADDLVHEIYYKLDEAERIKQERLYYAGIAKRQLSGIKTVGALISNPIGTIAEDLIDSKEIRKRTKKSHYPFLIIAIIMSIALMITVRILESSANGDMYKLYTKLPILLAISMVMWALFIIGHFKERKNKKEMIASHSVDTQKEIDLIESARTLNQNNMDTISVFPEEYRYPSITSYIRRLFESDRVDTMREALNLADEQIHRWKLEDAQNNLLKANEEQARVLKDMAWQQFWFGVELHQMNKRQSGWL